MSCAEAVEPINLPFGLWTQVGRRKYKFNCIRQVAPMGPHGMAQIRQNRPSVAACGLMSNYSDLLLICKSSCQQCTA